MKYIKKFDTVSAQTEYLNSADIDTYLGYVDENNTVYYDNNIVIQYQKKYLTIEALDDGNLTISYRNTFEYSTNKGITWTPITSANTVSFNAGDNIMLKITNNGNGMSIDSSDGIGTIKYTGRHNVYGNVMSLRVGDRFKEISDDQINNWFTHDIFRNLFSGDTALVSAEHMILPVTELKDSCYYQMFRGCTSLTTAPQLPATTLAEHCYQYMFLGCTSLTTAPELPATTLANYCYGNMFNGCTSLNYIKCLATDISANNCTYNFVSNVASTGTFVKAASMSSWTTGNYGIPANWTVQNDDCSPVDDGDDWEQ